MRNDQAELGWVGNGYDDPDVVALREHLVASTGIAGLETLEPTEIDRAVELFYRDGFVVVRNVLDAEQLETMRAGCDRVVRQILEADPARAGNRGSHRYSFGSSSLTGQLLHEPEWQMLIDLPVVTPLVTAIFGSSDYRLRGSGGDFCLPGAVEYQRLHADIGDRREVDGVTFGSFYDPRGVMSIRDLPCPYVCCNFLMVDFTATNGPTRQIPGTQHSRAKPPSVDDEPEWMKLSTVCPASAGSVLIRDVRAWHGGTPNLSDHVRCIPNVEYFAPWFRDNKQRCITRSDWEKFTPHGQAIARDLVIDSTEELETGFRVVPQRLDAKRRS